MARDERIEALPSELGAKQREIERLTEKMRKVLARLYGRRSEKIDPGHLLVFAWRDAPSEEAAEHVTEAPDDEEVPDTRRKKGRKGRALKLEDLPRVRIFGEWRRKPRSARAAARRKPGSARRSPRRSGTSRPR